MNNETQAVDSFIYWTIGLLIAGLGLLVYYELKAV